MHSIAAVIQPAQSKKVTADKLKKEYEAALGITNFAGYKGKEAVSKARKIIGKKYGPDCIRLLELTHLMAQEQKVPYLTAFDLGQKMGGLSAQHVEMLLKFKGFIESYRGPKNRLFYRPTEKGSPYITLKDTCQKHENGTTVKRLLYRRDILKSFAPQNVVVN